MALPFSRNSIRIVRGDHANLVSVLDQLGEGEIAYAKDENRLYVKEGTELVEVAPHHQAVLQGQDISQLNNDAGFITLAQVPPAAVSSVAGKTGSVSLDRTDVGLDQVENTSDAGKPISNATQDALNLKADLVNGVIPTAQIPALAITEFLGVAADEAAMLALSGQPGDWCLRGDVSIGYVIIGADTSLASSWQSLSLPGGGGVASVNNQTGVVTLGAADVGAAPAATADVAATALQPGANVSELTNDAGYLNSLPANLGVPAGTVIHVVMQTPPAGFLAADGSVLFRSEYPELFAAIGDTFGGNGSTTFGLPDLRGEFIRSWDNGRGVDDGRALGSFQEDQMEYHGHSVTVNGQGLVSSYGSSAQHAWDSEDTTNLTTGALTGSAGAAGGTHNSSESRPRNIALLACIKF